jgi:chromate transport protein ChrA
LPSAIALVLFAYGASALSGTTGIGLLHGLKLVAVAIVAQAVWGMARTLSPDRERASIAVVAALLILLNTSSVAQIVAIVLGGIAGLWLCRAAPPTSTGHISERADDDHDQRRCVQSQCSHPTSFHGRRHASRAPPATARNRHVPRIGCL